MGHIIKPIGGFKILLDETASTQTFTQDLIKSNIIPHGTVIMARHQTQGKGRLDKAWTAAPSENFTGSFFLRFETGGDTFHPSMISMLAALSVRQAVQAFIQEPVYIKWPNDIICLHKKLAGILITNQWHGKTMESSIVGIGINLNQIQFNQDLPQASSLRALSGNYIDRMSVMTSLITALNQWYQSLTNQLHNHLYQAYHNHLWGWQKTVQVQCLGEVQLRTGRILEVMPDGKIKIDLGLQSVAIFDLDEIKIIF